VLEELVGTEELSKRCPPFKSGPNLVPGCPRLVERRQTRANDPVIDRNNDHGQWAYEYGEIELDDFDKVLESLADKSKGVDGDRGVFFDIGSGTGKCVMSAAASGNFKKTVGVELVQSTHTIAECLMEECKIDVLPGLPPVELESRHTSLFDDTSWLEVPKGAHSLTL